VGLESKDPRSRLPRANDCSRTSEVEKVACEEEWGIEEKSKIEVELVESERLLVPATALALVVAVGE
jgi:hypothetical protein